AVYAEAGVGAQQALRMPDLRVQDRAADDRNQRMRWVGHDPTQRRDLALYQESRYGRQVLRDSGGRGVGPMRRAEGVVDVELAKGGQLPGEVGVVFRLSRMEADVLQHYDLAVPHRLHGGLDRRTHGVIQMTNRAAEQLAEPPRQRRGPIRLIGLAVRAPEVRDQYDAR